MENTQESTVKWTFHCKKQTKQNTKDRISNVFFAQEERTLEDWKQTGKKSSCLYAEKLTSTFWVVEQFNL